MDRASKEKHLSTVSLFRVWITDRNAESLYLCRFPAFVLSNGSSLALFVGGVMYNHCRADADSYSWEQPDGTWPEWIWKKICWPYRKVQYHQSRLWQDFRTDWKQKGSEGIIQGIHPGIGKAGCFGRGIRWGTLEQSCSESGGKVKGWYTIHL